MIVRVQFIDFTATPVSEEALAWMRNFSFDVKPGRVTMVTELIDARSGNTVIRMADMQDGMSQGIAGDLQPALTGWSNIVATAGTGSAIRISASPISRPLESSYSRPGSA